MGANKINYYRICVLTCWSGPFPWFLPYFVHSCLHNPTIEFYIITDNKELISNKPDNVIVVYKTIEEIKAAALQKLGFSINVDHPYKFNDFKPAYAFLFPEIIKGYHFWGYGDIDIVYGNIRCFITEEFLNSYDIINSRHESIAGSFCLFRNNEQINTLLMESKDYRKVFSNAEYLGFDECSFLMMELQMGASIFDFPDSIHSMTYLVRNAMLNNKIRAFFDFIIIEGMSNKIKWDKGKIIYKNEFEGLYYNLITYKKKCKNPVVLNPMPDVFYFKKSGITATKRIANKTQRSKV